MDRPIKSKTDYNVNKLKKSARVLRAPQERNTDTAPSSLRFILFKQWAMLQFDILLLSLK